jgi:anti-sigma regulatory factor (Ser/Thr protein kinase)
MQIPNRARIPRSSWANDTSGRTRRARIHATVVTATQDMLQPDTVRRSTRRRSGCRCRFLLRARVLSRIETCGMAANNTRDKDGEHDGGGEDGCQLAVGRLRVPDDMAIMALHDTESPGQLRLRVPTDPAILSDVRRVLRAWLQHQGAGADDVTEVIIAVHEACANAIEHGYSDAAREFELNALAGVGELAVTVRDRGRWRAPRERNRGRGLAMIAAAMDEVDINRSPAGTEVTMRRRLTGR